MSKNEMELLGNPPTFPTVPEGRVYIHSRCSSATEISGFDFIRLCTPGGRTPTICARCKKAFPLKEFVWRDSGEQVTAYLDRLKLLLPQPYREARDKMMRVAGIGSVVGAILGGVIGYAVEASIPSVIGGVFVGLIVGLIGGGVIGGRIYPAHIEFRKYI